MWQKLERTWLKYDGMFTYLSYKEFSGKVLQGRCASPRVIRDPRSVLPVLHSATLRVRLSSEQFPAVPTAAHPTCIQGAEGGKGGRRVCFLFSDEVSGTFHRTLSIYTELYIRPAHQHLETRKAGKPGLPADCKSSSYKLGIFILRDEVSMCAWKEASTGVSAMEQ